MNKNKIACPFSTFRRFPNFLGDDVAELREKIEATAVADENEVLIWLRQRKDLPSVFGVS